MNDSRQPCLEVLYQMQTRKFDYLIYSFARPDNRDSLESMTGMQALAKERIQYILFWRGVVVN